MALSKSFRVLMTNMDLDLKVPQLTGCCFQQVPELQLQEPQIFLVFHEADLLLHCPQSLSSVVTIVVISDLELICSCTIHNL